MRRNFLNSQTKSISSASLILAVSYLASAVLGLLRDHLLAGTFGAGNELDIYYSAFTVPDFIALILIFGAISAAVIPIFSGYLLKDKEEAWKYVATLLNVFLGFLIIICVILIIFAPAIVSITAPGFLGHKKDLAVMLMRIMFLSPIILGASNLISGILQVFHRFLVTALAPLLYNLGIIIGIVFFVPKFGLVGLAFGVVLGGVLHLTIQLPSFLHSGFKYRLNFNFRDPGIVKTIKLMAPRSLGLGAGQLNTIATTAIASTLMAGSIAVFNLANNLSLIFINAIAVSVTTAAFPSMSMAFLKNEGDEFLNKFSSIFRQMIFITTPLALLILILRAQIVRVVLGAGRFGWADTKLTTACLGILAFNLIAPQLILFLSKTFYAAHNTKIPAIISGATVVFNICLSLFLVWFIKVSPGFYIFLQNFLRLGGAQNVGVIGLALSYSISGILQTSLLLFMFYKKFPNLKIKEILNSLYKVLIASAIMFTVTFIARQILGSVANLQTFWGVFFQLVISGIIGVATYALATHLLKSPENKTIIDSLLKKFVYSAK
ncbi:MAG: murein biosynthesis integral membrane protein MurJ [Candidatus Staskawiczbacteria bacterium RIFOXYB1_FULL_37_44]|uniref:Probable lipid II flippase MurJ n=1 Tax=Candidatus Staskawiczbacteria bacterium RIFOXYB1_FULL_37_44 TaxID=1802223 RepID=A0A1G2IV22_9BACT|nr:MAG: murein biosynthesis integral membrane protein MurJ [Candidatus Staskawiczbacteria bacterium RIFOXYB1_FULL_37_44]OGZ83843.1 MAG: murein biosynthesis integral membrane protein MurJ [Candidatus Staskawiczbacteria bacterium RIFOXYC1_FULL_37_52]OGZ89350.1 MAG: murein biosynthesis integral membrane protein MurJ [Candidatus Staskawiczbacteria bacterium RIFOXYD1_FULL_37_110]